MKTNNPKARAQSAFQKAVTKAQYQAQEHATMGWRRSATVVEIDVPGRANYVYVTRSDQTVFVARNEANVPRAAFLPVRVVLRGETYVIVGRDTSNDTLLGNVPDSPYGLPPHPLKSHSDVPSSYVGQAGKLLAIKVTEDGWEFVDPAGGAVDSVNGQTGVVVLDTDDIAEGASNRYLTQERVEDYAAAMITVGTHLGISASYDDLTGLLSLDARTAGDARYAPIAKGVTNGDSHDHVGGDGGTIAYSSLSGTPTVYTQEQIEDFVGAMLAGTQTGITVTYDDATGRLIFDAQTAGDARYGRLATANSWTQNQTIASTQTTGNALRVIRNLTSTSTDAAVVDLIQDHASDDQAVLRIQQDGAAAIVNIYDTTDLVIQVADGGRLLLTPTATSGAGLSVIRDLASASTDWPVVDLIQENSGDDQAVLQLRQDGTGAILILKDGVNTVLTVADGGGWVANQVGISGVGFSFNRNLAAASTDSAVFEIVQDNTGDDQAVLRVQQDGTGNILQLYDGATLVFAVADGGVAAIGGTPIAGIRLAVIDGASRIRLESTTNDASAGFVMVALGAAGTQRIGGFYWKAHETTALSFFGATADNSTFGLKLFQDNRVGIGNISAPVATTDIIQTQTTGNTLRAYRNLTATSTDSPVVDIIQDHASDDQPVLRLQQDGTGDILVLYDGAQIVLQVKDGGSLTKQAGGSTDDVAVGGVLYVTTTQAGNAAGSTSDLASCTIPANMLAVNGQSIWFEAMGSYANNANGKTVAAVLGTSGVTSVGTTGAITPANSTWFVRGRIIRTGAATQKGTFVFQTGASTLSTGRALTLDQTLSGSLVFKITGTGTAANDVVLEYMIVGYDDNNT